MAKFDTPLICLVPFGVADARYLYKYLIYQTDIEINPLIIKELQEVLDVNGRIYLKNGFKYDGASTGMFRMIYPKFGKKYDYGTPVHDRLCNLANKHKGTPLYKHLRKFADDVFNEIMILSGVSTWRRWTMYKAVRGYGIAVDTLN